LTISALPKKSLDRSSGNLVVKLPMAAKPQFRRKSELLLQGNPLQNRHK